MKSKKVLFTGSIAFLILLLLLTGCRRFNGANSSSSQSAGISMASERQKSSVGASSTTTASQTESSPDTEPADSKETGETLDQILSELKGLDSLYSQMDDVSDADLNN